ncbi:bZIP transcription factor 44-like [Juglans microcarpa x Juglans regia]|uniref:bZIP transcription factor 44-like n=1 Tax=Juglans microcarpa x Juglans regia TaxID=2249226 RepID=UPI001B7E2185|nr:bZIP transcription factor 44-like [Juglans microcarpa x Juglans regia]
MPSTQSASSGSEADAIKYGLMDEKKRKRMQSNRESAKRSRMKQQKKMEDLVDEKAMLLRELKKNSASYSGRERGWHSLESENNLLIAEKMCLAKRLDKFNSLIVNLGLVENNTPKSPELIMLNTSLLPQCSLSQPPPEGFGLNSVSGRGF